MTMPSAQEGRFRFGDKIPQPIDGKQYIFVRYMPHTNPPAIELLCDKPECLWMTEDELAPYLEPADSPGRAVAQHGWRERMGTAIKSLKECASAAGHSSAYGDEFAEPALANAEIELLDLLDEVIELPEPPKIPLVLYSEIGQRWNLTTNHLNTDRGLLLMASALIAAAREGKAK